MTTDTDVGTRVCELFRRGLHVNRVELDIPLLDYGLDSVRSTELVIELEQEFGIEIDDEVAATLLTARQVIEHVLVVSERHRIGV